MDRMVECFYEKAQDLRLNPRIVSCDNEDRITSFAFEIEHQLLAEPLDILVTEIFTYNSINFGTRFARRGDGDSQALEKLRNCLQSKSIGRVVKFTINNEGVAADITMLNISHNKCNEYFAQCYANMFEAIRTFAKCLEEAVKK